MVDFRIESEIDTSILKNHNTDYIEAHIKDRFVHEMVNEMKKKMDDFMILDIEPTHTGFNITSHIVVGSFDSLSTALQIAAQKMKEDGLSTERIEEILTIMTQDYKGF